MRPFLLLRAEDASGVSGTGAVAEGVVWADGSVALHWLTRTPSWVLYKSIEDVEHIHGHGGKTRVWYIPLQPAPAAAG